MHVFEWYKRSVTHQSRLQLHATVYFILHTIYITQINSTDVVCLVGSLPLHMQGSLSLTRWTLALKPRWHLVCGTLVLVVLVHLHCVRKRSTP